MPDTNTNEDAEKLMRIAEAAKGLPGYGVTAAFVSELNSIIDCHTAEARITELKELALDHYQGKTFSDSTDYKAKFEKFVRNNERRIRELGGRDG